MEKCQKNLFPLFIKINDKHVSVVIIMLVIVIVAFRVYVKHTYTSKYLK